MPTFAELLTLSTSLEEKIASSTEDARPALLRKKAMVDFVAFDLFKQANFTPALKAGLGWGAGVGLPVLGGGMLLTHYARQQAEEAANHLRNQALLASLGVGGGMLLQHMLAPTQQETLHQEQDPTGALRRAYEVTKLSEDSTLRKLAAALLLDDVLLEQLRDAPAGEKRALEDCLLMCREHGMALLRRLG